MNARLFSLLLLCFGTVLSGQASGSGSGTPNPGGGTSGPPPTATNTYTVSSAADGYVDLPAPTALTLADDDLTAWMSLGGYTLRYFGKTYGQFRVGSNGYILIGNGAATTSTSPQQAGAIAPYWADLAPAAGQIGYELSVEGILIVEWRDVDVRVGGATGTYAVRMQAHINCVTAAVEFRYAQPTNGLAGPTSGTAGTVSVSDLAGITTLVVPGTDAGFVETDGSVSTWPTGRRIRYIENGPMGNGEPVRIESSSVLPQATPGSAYQHQFTSAGGSATHNWLPRVTTSLPQGWTLSLSGALTIDAAYATTGVYLFWLNAYGTQLQDGKYFMLVIADPLVIMTTSPLPAGTENSPYSLAFQASGGIAPHTWSASGLPAGWNIDTAGNLTAPPASVIQGQYNFSVTVADAQALPVQVTLPCVIDIVLQGAPLVITTTGLAPGVEGVAYSHQFTAAGGYPGYTWSASNLPAGWTMDVGGVLSAPPSAVASGTYNFSAIVEDTQLNTTSSPFTVLIASTSTGPGPNVGANSSSGCSTGGSGPGWLILLGLVAALVTIRAVKPRVV
ncbi:MAG: hypothetical protein IT464_10485 [Planctomycetes bacterium]|nr:hypothetical protein [Planctomycetota bacterium]